jgi:RNA polymerase sigma factor (sigma-70 family)
MDLIYNEHAKSVFKYLVSLSHDTDLAEELTQETFYRAIYSLDTYNGSCKVSVWLCQIAKHIWYQELEKRKKSQVAVISDFLPSSDMSPEENTILSEDKLELYTSIHSLGEHMKEVMYLRLSGEFNFREIGQILGKDETWARVTFYRAKQKIMKGAK